MILTSTRFRRRPSRLTGQPELPALKDPLPVAKIQTAVGHRDHHLAAHDLPLHMGVSIVFGGVIVPVLPDGRMGGQPLQPLLVIHVQAPLVVVSQKALLPDAGAVTDYSPFAVSAIGLLG
jgi:hypothetical protein